MKYITVIGCKKCRRCYNICPTKEIEHIDGTARVKIIHEKCNLCTICVKMCPNKALKILE